MWVDQKTRYTCRVLFSVSMSVSIFDCGARVDSAQAIGASKAITMTESQEFCDQSTGICTLIVQCDWVGPGRHNTAICGILSADYVMVSGGAEIEGTSVNGFKAPGPQPGALLTESAPTVIGESWVWEASSTDHDLVFLHRLRAYAIGLKLPGIVSVDLNKMLKIRRTVSGIARRPTATQQISAGEILVGGGAVAIYSGDGQLLTESYPSSTTAWTASSKDHNHADPGQVVAWAVSIPACPAGYVHGCIATRIISENLTGFSGGGYLLGCAGYSNPTTAVGAQSLYGGDGRMLTALFPSLGTCEPPGPAVSSKDHETTDVGRIQAYAIRLQ
jgi:hypothetical protein